MKNFIKKITLFYCIYIVSILSGCKGNVIQPVVAETHNVIDVRDFGVSADSGADSTLGVIDALEVAKKTGAKKIIFPQGRYDFYATRAKDVYAFISNNDEGLKSVAFHIDGFEQLEIDGQGSVFMFHGFMSPFIVSNSKNVTFSHFSIDFFRTFHQEAEILAVGNKYMDLRVLDDFPFRISRAGILEFIGFNEQPAGVVLNKTQARLERRKEQTYSYESMLEFDAVKRETAYMVRDQWVGSALPAERLGEIKERKIRIHHPDLVGTPGNIMTFVTKRRDFPGFFLRDSAELLFDGITIHHANGMGIVGERCHNVTVQNSKVTPSGNRMVSTTADATHFVNCTGKINLINNLFENQKDDATNIHGVYAQVDSLVDDKTVDVRMQHPHQYGFDFIHEGDELELVQGPSMKTYTTRKVESVSRLSKQITRVTFTKAYPNVFTVGDSVAAVRDYPEVLIKGNTIRRNRARGMLLNCRGKTVVEDNYFHSPGAAILFEGDAVFWFEQGGVNDLIIRNNVFDNNNYGVWGKAVLDVAAGISEEHRSTARYNKNILIEGNEFRMFDDGPILSLFSVDGLVFRNNKIIKTNAYPERKLKTGFFDVQYSDNVVIEKNNTFSGFE